METIYLSHMHTGSWGYLFHEIPCISLYFFSRGFRHVALIIKSSCDFFLFIFTLYRRYYKMSAGSTLKQVVQKLNFFFFFLEFWNFSYSKLFYLIPRFLFLMTVSATNLALKLVIRHDELENVNHGVLCAALVEVSGTQIIFHWIGLKSWPINMWSMALFVH